MLTKKEALKTRTENYQRIKLFVRIFLTMGVNISAPTRIKDSLKIITLGLIIISGISLYGHWRVIKPHLDNIPEATETILTAFQIIIAIVKVGYMFFVQRRFYVLLEQALNHTVLQEIKIFKQDYPINDKLKREITNVMTGVWKRTRKQLVFYLIVYLSISNIYILPPLLINYYNKLKGTLNYAYLTPLESSVWEENVMSFPYYHIHMFVDICAIHLAAGGGTCFDVVYIILCLHATGLMRVLCLIVLRSTTELVPKEARDDYMRYCISHYQRTYIFFTDVQKMYMHINLSQFGLTMLEFALILYKMNVALESDKLTFIRMGVHLITCSSMCTLYCYNGQQLSTTSEEIPFAFYNCLWYDESMEFKKMVQMMILRTNKQLHFNISWLAPMNLISLIAMYRMSYSYFLILRDISD